MRIISKRAPNVPIMDEDTFPNTRTWQILNKLVKKQAYKWLLHFCHDILHAILRLISFKKATELTFSKIKLAASLPKQISIECDVLQKHHAYA